MAFDVFTNLSKVKCETKKKGRFDYVSWAEAWREVKKLYPQANFRVYTTENGFPAFINMTGGFVKVGVIIEDLEHIEFMPILDSYKKSIPKENITTNNINDSIKRCLVKCLALHGLGLNVFLGEEFKGEKDE